VYDPISSHLVDQNGEVFLGTYSYSIRLLSSAKGGYILLAMPSQQRAGYPLSTVSNRYFIESVGAVYKPSKAEPE